MNEPTSWSEAGIAIASILMVTAVITVVVWQIFGTWRARMVVSREEAYRKLAEEATALQRRIAENQHRIAEELADLRTRMTAVERLPREVE